MAPLPETCAEEEVRLWFQQQFKSWLEAEVCERQQQAAEAITEQITSRTEARLSNMDEVVKRRLCDFGEQLQALRSQDAESDTLRHVCDFVDEMNERLTEMESRLEAGLRDACRMGAGASACEARLSALEEGMEGGRRLVQEIERRVCCTRLELEALRVKLASSSEALRTGLEVAVAPLSEPADTLVPGVKSRPVSNEQALEEFRRPLREGLRQHVGGEGHCASEQWPALSSGRNEGDHAASDDLQGLVEQLSAAGGLVQRTGESHVVEALHLLHGQQEKVAEELDTIRSMVSEEVSLLKGQSGQSTLDVEDLRRAQASLQEVIDSRASGLETHWAQVHADIKMVRATQQLHGAAIDALKKQQGAGLALPAQSPPVQSLPVQSLPAQGLPAQGLPEACEALPSRWCRHSKGGMGDLPTNS